MGLYRITRAKLFDLVRYCADNKIALKLVHAGQLFVEGFLDDDDAQRLKSAGFWVEKHA